MIPSITQILFAALVAVIAWKGKAILNAFLLRSLNPEENEKEQAPKPTPKQKSAPRDKEPSDPEAIDLAPCPRCGVYKDRASSCSNCTS